uniref:Histone-lysine N-methyltransferase SETMAR n=1 Tax=Acrobeloides nanus TaxID=290746 RepID=A0A914C6A3_9BILA
MEKNRGIIRELLKFEFELDHSAKEAMDNINRAKGNGTVSKKLEDMGWEYLEHPPYTPGLSPSDFYLFRSLEHWLRGKKFRTIEEMRESLTEFFDSKDREWYRRGIHKLEEQWQKVIESGGE